MDSFGIGRGALWGRTEGARRGETHIGYECSWIVGIHSRRPLEWHTYISIRVCIFPSSSFFLSLFRPNLRCSSRTHQLSMLLQHRHYVQRPKDQNATFLSRSSGLVGSILYIITFLLLSRYGLNAKYLKKLNISKLAATSAMPEFTESEIFASGFLTI